MEGPRATAPRQAAAKDGIKKSPHRFETDNYAVTHPVSKIPGYATVTNLQQCLNLTRKF